MFKTSFKVTGVEVISNKVVAAKKGKKITMATAPAYEARIEGFEGGTSFEASDVVELISGYTMAAAGFAEELADIAIRKFEDVTAPDRLEQFIDGTQTIIAAGRKDDLAGVLHQQDMMDARGMSEEAFREMQEANRALTREVKVLRAVSEGQARAKQNHLEAQAKREIKRIERKVQSEMDKKKHRVKLAKRDQAARERELARRKAQSERDKELHQMDMELAEACNLPVFEVTEGAATTEGGEQ